jgi:NAD(P)-dependent dehydrogenase (short-subunit alcohol dehydrogenase family)
MRFSGKNVIVTGGSSGIGRATVLSFAAEGAHVLAAGRNVDRLVAVAREAPFGTVDTTVVDIAVPHQARALVRDAAASYGRIHVLVNNAGIALSDHILDMPEQNWHLTLATNLSAAFFASQEAARHMVALAAAQSSTSPRSMQLWASRRKRTTTCQRPGWSC